MKLIISIVNRDDSNALVDSLMRHGYRATVISTSGGFLREGNATLMVGAEEDQVLEVLNLIQEGCHTRTRYVNPQPASAEPDEAGAPAVEVQVGKATIFVLNVSDFQRF